MERLVYKEGNVIQIKGWEDKMCYDFCDDFNSNCDKCIMIEVLNLLNDYQDTKLQPKQLEKLKTKYKELQKENRKLKREMLKMLKYAWYQEDEYEKE